MNTTFVTLGDPHAGRQFLNNVPLHRRGDHEAMVWAEFEKQLDPRGAEVHVCMGDLYDRAIVPYGVVWRTAQAYLEAAFRHPSTLFVVLRGNHDASRNLEAISAFDLFTGLVARATNIRAVKDHHAHNELVFFGWHPVLSATEVIDAFRKEGRPDQQYLTSFSHNDVDPRSDPFNIIPIAELKELGITKAYTGHDHLKREIARDGLAIVVTGSMLPYAHGEDATGRTYVTMTLAEATAATDLHDKCVRIKLFPGEVFDLELDCLQLQVIRPEEDVGMLDVSIGDFDLKALFDGVMVDHQVPADIQAEVRQRWDSAFTTRR